VSRRISSLIFFFAFLALMIALHLALLRMPFHWDELGQFAPAAHDLYEDGSLVPHSTLPNVHPPGVMAIAASRCWWSRPLVYCSHFFSRSGFVERRLARRPSPRCCS
jgi:hypothetical protein